MLFLAGVVSGVLAAFAVAYWFGQGIHRRLHEADWFGPDEPFHVHTHTLETGCEPKGLSVDAVTWDEPVAPGTAVFGGAEEGLVSYADLAPGKPNLEQVIANMAGPPKPAAPEPPQGARNLTYIELIASQPPKPEATQEQRKDWSLYGRALRSGKGTTIVATDATEQQRAATGLYCHRHDGRSAITTAEITARAQEMVDAREATS